jgi:hypothetical protein
MCQYSLKVEHDFFLRIKIIRDLLLFFYCDITERLKTTKSRFYPVFRIYNIHLIYHLQYKCRYTVPLSTSTPTKDHSFNFE